MLSQPTLRAFVLHLRFISRKMWKTKSLFTRSHIICETCFNLFFLSLQVFEGSRTGKDCSKGKFGSSKKQKHAWGKNNFLLRYRASACQACVLSDLACSTHTFKKKKVKQSHLHLLKNSGGTPFSVEKMAFYCSNEASVLLVVSCVTSACRSF